MVLIRNRNESQRIKRPHLEEKKIQTNNVKRIGKLVTTNHCVCVRNIVLQKMKTVLIFGLVSTE